MVKGITQLRSYNEDSHRLLERIPFDKQQEFLTTCFSGNYDYINYGGSVRGGKSIALMFLLDQINLKFGDQYPRYAMIREDRPQFTSQTMPKFWEVFDQEEIEQMPTSHNGYICKFKGGLEIIFFAENFDSQFKYLEDFKGLEVDGFLFEEISGIHKKTWQKSFERVGTWKMKERQKSLDNGIEIPPRIIASTCNPSPNWIKKEIYDKWITGTLPERFSYLPSSVYDNPNISEDWIENKKEVMSSQDFEMFVNGDWNIIDNENPFYPLFLSAHSSLVRRNRLEINPNEFVWLSFDFNYDPCTCIIAQLIDDFGLYIYDTVQVTGGTEALCDVLISDYNILDYADKMGLRVTGDNSGYSRNSRGGINDFDRILDKFMISANHLRRYKSGHSHFEWIFDMTHEVMRTIPMGFNKDGNTVLIDDLKKAVRTKDKKKYKNRDNGHLHDASDAFDYLIGAMFENGYRGVRRWKEKYEYLTES